MKGTATETDIPPKVSDRMFYNRAARVYELDPPIDTETGPVRHVIISTADYEGSVTTYVIPCGADGITTDWGHVVGTHPGVRDHATVLDRAGYKVVTK
ncbi:hypothetical protein [Nocardia cyriacigeorgica]|uniref:hypothetical protein n=1 Tax=Nocardia cyriacigeorgica TaxID=135487 RepID=UPI0024544B62|nr:hypothetical protein [Nocardia cyriacigeorgica]